MTWEDLKFFGYGLLGLRPDTLFKLTIAEIFDMVIAYYRRRDDELEEQMTVLAWQTSHIMNSSGNYKKQIKPSQLYGGRQEAEGNANSELTPVDREKKNAEIAKLEAQFK